MIGSITKDEEEINCPDQGKLSKRQLPLILIAAVMQRNFSEYEGKYNLLRDEPFDGKVEGA